MIFCFEDECNVFLALSSSLYEVCFVFAHVFALQSVLKLSFPLVLITNFTNAKSYLLLSTCLLRRKWHVICLAIFHLFQSDYLSLNTNRFEVFNFILIFNQITKNT
jgi:hypothetical protein